MSSRTKIVVLHMKEIIYTAIFAALALLVIVLLIFMFGTGKKDSAVKNEKQYTPGTYTSTLTLNNTNLEVEVSVDAYKINSIRFSNLDETVTTMFPLIQPAIEEIAEQIYETQMIAHQQEKYSWQFIFLGANMDAVSEAVEKAAVK